LTKIGHFSSSLASLLPFLLRGRGTIALDPPEAKMGFSQNNAIEGYFRGFVLTFDNLYIPRGNN
jgi:hypothetical protein